MSLLILPLMLWMGVYTVDQVLHQSPRPSSQVQNMQLESKTLAVDSIEK